MKQGMGACQSSSRTKIAPNAGLEGSWACSNHVNFSKGDQAGFQSFLQLVCLVTATVLRIKAGSFLGFYSVFVGWYLVSPEWSPGQHIRCSTSKG